MKDRIERGSFASSSRVSSDDVTYRTRYRSDAHSFRVCLDITGRSRTGIEAQIGLQASTRGTVMAFAGLGGFGRFGGHRTTSSREAPREAPDR